MSIHEIPPAPCENRPELEDKNLVTIFVEAIMKKSEVSGVDRKGKVGLVCMAVLVVSAYLIPYTVLTEIPRWYGSGLYWVLFALASIFVIAWLTAEWRE